jgi:hypothetical protein
LAEHGEKNNTRWPCLQHDGGKLRTGLGPCDGAKNNKGQKNMQIPGIDRTRGLRELRAIRAEARMLFAAVFVFSVFVNILMLTGPLYMLQVYDRVLGSRSEETLIALSILCAFLFVAMGMLDHARARLMARVAARFQQRLDRRVFEAGMRRLSLLPNDQLAGPALRDLEAVQRLLASPVLISIFDIPWTPFFIAAIFVFHPLLGYQALIGGAILVAIAVWNQWATREPLLRASAAAMEAERLSESLKAEAETLQSLGMSGAGFTRLARVRGEALNRATRASDITGRFSGSAGAGGLAGAAGAAQFRRDDRGVNPAGPRAGTDRAGGRAVGGGQPRARGVGAAVGAADGAACGTAAHPPAPAQGCAGHPPVDRGAAG